MCISLSLDRFLDLSESACESAWKLIWTGTLENSIFFFFNMEQQTNLLEAL